MLQKNSKLYNWLEKTFYEDNHPKYKHYFNEWVINLTDSQIQGFEHQMFVQESGVLNSQSIRKK